ncbi:MAG: hypothetical protein GY774_10610 [Planctomycetes bacterium]|nr:hypothetical protein [Planctomycetota bacterium]
MARNLVALKLDVGLTDEGQAAYPNFNLISNAVRKGMDWSSYIDTYGGGMHYDKTCGHKEESTGSPYGHQCCCMCVPEDFALEALNLFPKTVSRMTEAEFEAFHDDKAHAHEDDEKVSTDTLNGLAAQRSLMVVMGQDILALDAKIKKALDPNEPTEAGVVKNKNKKWVDVKANKGLSIV